MVTQARQGHRRRRSSGVATTQVTACELAILLVAASGCASASTLDNAGPTDAASAADATAHAGTGADDAGTPPGDASADAPDATGAGTACEAGIALVAPDAASCFLDLTQYDRSCSVDSDCVSSVALGCAVYDHQRPIPALYVRGGNFCNGCNCNTGLAINQRAVASFTSDVARTPQGSGGAPFPVCNCPLSPPSPPACVHGVCGFDGADAMGD